MKIRKCRHCEKEFDLSDKAKGWLGNHTRWCNKNPKRQSYIDDLIKRDIVGIMKESKKNSGRTNQYTVAKLEGKAMPESPLKGKKGLFSGKKHSEKSKKLLREKALNSPHRRLRIGIVEYKGVLLDSSWELELAKRLDMMEIKWIRPDPIPWVDKKGVVHNYFPDFYLLDYDLFLDPKNKQAIKVQKEKIDCLMDQYKNIIIICSLEECKNYVLP